jgi:hypothetical protein
MGKLTEMITKLVHRSCPLPQTSTSWVIAIITHPSKNTLLFYNCWNLFLILLHSHLYKICLICLTFTTVFTHFIEIMVTVFYFQQVNVSWCIVCSFINSFFHNNLILQRQRCRKRLRVRVVHKALFLSWKCNTCCARACKLPASIKKEVLYISDDHRVILAESRATIKESYFEFLKFAFCHCKQTK